jgi:histidine triad (HIT) family protein
MSHAPEDYDCPFCRVAQDRFDASVWTTADDMVFRGRDVCAFVSSSQFSTDPAYPGHVLVIPAAHHENVYVLPDDVLARVGALRRRVSIAFSRLGADGTSSRQHNEPAGNQDVWHYHEHVFPRFAGDRLYVQDRVPADPSVRAARAETLRAALRAVLDDVPLDPS